MRRNRFNKYYCKIVLTGGPCAGKTTLLSQLADRLKKEYGDEWQVFTVSEASTLLYSGGVARHMLSLDQLAVWQRDMLLTIFRLEEVFENIAMNETKKHTIILCDRGGMDPKVFTKSDQQWQCIIDSLGISEEVIFDRYDLILRLHTALKPFYEQMTNIARREDYIEAQDVNAKYDMVWHEHPLFRSIPSELELKEKFEHALSEIEELLKNAV